MADKVLSKLRRAARKAESALLDIQASSNRPEVAGFEDLLHLKDVQDALAATKHLEQALSPFRAHCLAERIGGPGGGSRASGIDCL